MAYNTLVQIDTLEVIFNSDKTSYPEIRGWRTGKELKDVVIEIGTTLSANWDGTHIYTLDSQKFQVASPDPDNFTPFEDLTESQCVNFVKATPRYWSVMSILTGYVYDSMQAATQGLCALPWE
tara:strand:+ start:1259 stop:1627 length:369 start_codon:yes stop_codon:yes gene_type:complete